MDVVLSVLSFAFIASFTPGPNNILCMSQGISGGLRSTFRYQSGAGVACFVIIFGATLLGAQLEKLLPAVLPVMRYAGCAYMLYLAYVVATSKPVEAGSDGRTATFVQGFVLQFVNPKYYLYVVTLTSVIVPITHDVAALAGYSAFFAFLAVAGMFAWGACGAALQQFLRRQYRAANAVMGLALVYCSLSLL